jgi:hypothetical protein
MVEKEQLPYPSWKIYMKGLRPKYLIPKKEVGSITDISLEELKSSGIRSIILDVDNTICEYNGTSLNKKIENGVKDLTNNFNCCILSNTDMERRLNLEKYFGIPAIQTEVRKPCPEAFFEALKYLKSTPKDTAIIGDRLLSDISGGNMVGLFTIKVNPIKRSSEPFTHTLVRALETFVYRFYTE